MARIDRLVQAMFQSAANRLIMASGERLIMVVGDEHRPVSPQPVTVAQALFSPSGATLESSGNTHPSHR